MKRALLIVLAVAVTFSFISTGFAATRKATMEKSVKITGDVVKNDGKEMVVKGPKGEQKFDVSGVKNVDKYKEGDEVTISYKEKDGQLTASSISESMMKGNKAKEEKSETTERPKTTK
jgi:hypothetical protein